MQFFPVLSEIRLKKRDADRQKTENGIDRPIKQACFDGACCNPAKVPENDTSKGENVKEGISDSPNLPERRKTEKPRECFFVCAKRENPVCLRSVRRQQRVG